MNSIAFICAGAGIAAAIAASAHYNGGADAANPKPLAAAATAFAPVSRSTADAANFRIATPGGEQQCIVRRSRLLADGKVALSPGAACGELFAPLRSAAFWRRNGDGSIDFLGHGGERIVAFEPADGDGFVSYHPVNPILSMRVTR